MPGSFYKIVCLQDRQGENKRLVPTSILSLANSAAKSYASPIFIVSCIRGIYLDAYMYQIYLDVYMYQIYFDKLVWPYWQFLFMFWNSIFGDHVWFQIKRKVVDLTSIGSDQSDSHINGLGKTDLYLRSLSCLTVR